MYNFTTNRHVKIWLGPLKLQNELRLRNLRVINPDAILFLIYECRLLSASENRFIQALCEELHINLIDVWADIIPHCTTIDEQNLIDDYREAIQSVEQGGNQAAASDILRWLAPVYDLGTYSDIDVLIDVSRLPVTVKVSKPLLFNLGSISLFGTEHPVMNNDILAVVDAVSALPLIQSIQKTIHNGCRPYQRGSDAFGHLQERFSALPHHPDRSISSYLMTGSLPINAELSSIAEGKSMGQTRAEIIRITSNSSTYCDYYPWMCLFFTIVYSGSDFLFNSKIKEHRSILLRDSVIYSSGPGTTLVAFNEHPNYPADYFIKEKVPWSFEHYGLEQHFRTGNRIPLHSSYLDLMLLGRTKRTDVSWLEEGRSSIESLETKITALATNIKPSFDTTNITTQIATELNRLAGLHRMQLAEVQHQFRMNTLCNEQRSIQFASCSKVNGSSICVETNVHFQTLPFFSKDQFFSKDIDYTCQLPSTGEPGLVCSTSLSYDLCGFDGISSLATTATYSALAAAIPEAVGDALRLIANVSEIHANFATHITNLIFVALTGCWLSFIAGMMAQSAGKWAGLSKSSARLFGNTVAHTVNITQNLNASTLITTGVSLAAGQFGLWAEKKIVRQVEGMSMGKELAQKFLGD